MSDLFSELQQRAGELGFNNVGVSIAAPARRLDAYLRWIDHDRHGEMGYMARPDRVERRQNPPIILPGLQSIISVRLSYSTAQVPPEICGDPGRGRISNYAWNRDYHDLMTPRLEQLAERLAGFVGEPAGEPKTIQPSQAMKGAITTINRVFIS